METVQLIKDCQCEKKIYTSPFEATVACTDTYSLTHTPQLYPYVHEELIVILYTYVCIWTSYSHTSIQADWAREAERERQTRAHKYFGALHNRAEIKFRRISSEKSNNTFGLFSEILEQIYWYGIATILHQSTPIKLNANGSGRFWLYRLMKSRQATTKTIRYYSPYEFMIFYFQSVISKPRKVPVSNVSALNGIYSLYNLLRTLLNFRSENFKCGPVELYRWTRFSVASRRKRNTVTIKNHVTLTCAANIPVTKLQIVYHLTKKILRNSHDRPTQSYDTRSTESNVRFACPFYWCSAQTRFARFPNRIRFWRFISEAFYGCIGCQWA